MSKLIKTSGGDYATLAAWASYVNALSLSADETGYVSGVVSDTATVNVGGWTANGFSVILTAQAGEGISVGGRAWYLSSGRASIENSVTYAGAYVFTGENLVVRDIQIRATGSTANYVFALKSGVLVDRCIIRLQSSSQNAIKDINTGRGTVRACLIISSGGGAYAAGDGFDLERCTLVGSGTGTGVNSGPYAGLRAKGCAVIGFTTDFSGTSVASSTHNATDKGSFGGTGFDTSGQVSLASGDFVSTGSGTEDYQPVTGSTKLKNTGTTISGLSVDLFGNSASQGASPDIGAAEFTEAGGSSIAVISHYYSMMRAA